MLLGRSLILWLVELAGFDGGGGSVGDFEDVFVDGFERFVGGIVMVDGGAERSAEFLHVGFKRGDMGA